MSRKQADKALSCQAESVHQAVQEQQPALIGICRNNAREDFDSATIVLAGCPAWS
jgi:hypothetical protein